MKNTLSSSITSDTVDLLGVGLSNGYINFNTDTTSYNVSVPTDATSIIVQATPKDTDYIVKIDGTTVSESDEYKKTGWLQDKDGKWYYLQASGAMVANTVIDGYKLGADGAWIK